MKVYIVLIRENDVLETSRTFEAKDWNKASKEAERILQGLQKCTIEALEISLLCERDYYSNFV